MAIFNINGFETDTLSEAFEICREVWSLSKAPAVKEQLETLLSKPTALDVRRAELGLTPMVIRTVIADPEPVEAPVVEAAPPPQKRWWQR